LHYFKLIIAKIGILSCLCGTSIYAQQVPTVLNDSNKISKENLYFSHQKDIIDLAFLLIQKNPATRFLHLNTKSKRLQLSVSPILEYTISTGFTGGIAAAGAFYTGTDNETNLSSILGAIKYTQNKQFLLPIQSNIWTPHNKYNFSGDWRYLNYPQDTYGIGGLTTLNDRYTIDYKYVRFYESVLKKIKTNLYLGLGYQLDYHWGVSELAVPPRRITDFQKYGFSKASTSSGIAFIISYDSRKNSINPEGGSFYGNLKFVQNIHFLGSSNSWSSLQIDIRKYLKLYHNNVLAFWLYSVLTTTGSPPYLDLAGTGLDTYNNTGRGYELGRFIGKKFIDIEAEYRFAILNNGLIGGVVFCSAESTSAFNSNKFDNISPAFGVGLRIKFNKFSNTSACLDYGIGAKGSRGFFGNLGEVF